MVEYEQCFGALRNLAVELAAEGFEVGTVAVREMCPSLALRDGVSGTGYRVNYNKNGEYFLYRPAPLFLWGPYHRKAGLRDVVDKYVRRAQTPQP